MNTTTFGSGETVDSFIKVCFFLILLVSLSVFLFWNKMAWVLDQILVYKVFIDCSAQYYLQQASQFPTPHLTLTSLSLSFLNLIENFNCLGLFFCK